MSEVVRPRRRRASPPRKQRDVEGAGQAALSVGAAVLERGEVVGEMQVAARLDVLVGLHHPSVREAQTRTNVSKVRRKRAEITSPIVG